MSYLDRRHGVEEVLEQMRRELATELAIWLSGETTAYQAGRVAGIARAISRYTYAGPKASDEIALVLRDAHTQNSRARQSCACGRRGCDPYAPVPLTPVDELPGVTIHPLLDAEARRPNAVLPAPRRDRHGFWEIAPGLDPD